MSRLEIFSAETLSALELPFADEGVRAGFPSPAQHPESTVYARVVGDSMVDADVHQGDILMVDKSVEIHSGDMAVCILNGEFTVKYVDIEPDHVTLRPANDHYPPILVTEADSFEVWGVVTFVIKRTLRRGGAR